MSLKDYKVITIDVVGTLIDFEQGMLNYFRNIANKTEVTDETFLETYRKSRTTDTSVWYPDHLIIEWNNVSKKLDLPDSTAIAEGFRDSVRVWPAFSDSVEALKRLKNHFKLVAMTNTRRWAMSHFENTLGKLFDDIVTSDDALCEKPDPQFFAYTRGRLSIQGYTLKDILHVAQSQYHDIGVAHRLGYTVCWIERRYNKSGFGATKAVERITKPDFHFHSLAELADAVDATEI